MSSLAARRRFGAMVAGVLCAACAAMDVPPRTIDAEPRAEAALAGARAVWIAGALSRTGDVASGLAEPVGDGREITEELAGAVRRARGIELAPDREAADVVLYFEQADRLRCYRCPQSEDRWYWWGLVLDPAGRELARMHGETVAGKRTPAREFVAGVRSLTRRAPKT
jgi:hypothetical protein